MLERDFISFVPLQIVIAIICDGRATLLLHEFFTNTIYIKHKFDSKYIYIYILSINYDERFCVSWFIVFLFIASFGGGFIDEKWKSDLKI